MRTTSKILTGLWLLVALLLAGSASGAPIVFDFEDGLQSWELRGASQRVQTQVLGGEWAIFGDGFFGTAIVLSTDPILIGAISMEMFFVDGEADRFSLWSRTAPPQSSARVQHFELAVPGNPSLLSVEFGPDGRNVLEVAISWLDFPLQSDLGGVVAFIDNVTFHPVPEPGLLGLLGLLAVLGLRGLARRGAS